MTVRSVNLETIRRAVDKCCKTVEECGSCDKARCLIGFTQTVLDYAQAKNTWHIPQGHTFIPEDDLRLYYQEDLLETLSEILLQCHSCQDNHEEDCVISISRRAMERALFGEYMPFTGSIAAYLLQVARQEPALGEKLASLYQQKKKAASSDGP
ncbi:hypothetical protein [Thermanaeromonas sp. C210]|uniref:hypothetical protein n=1 Tax=Thermanaeromonas sp. C210 TaxID=2731925 RepID=UPI00155B7377|nr:hypothetical protein [Thermanaeromonas sp. C210]GFN22906.1 hypothetical protein TAMC210_12230 [Thermanaeromonas sp. C210]